MKTSEIIRRFMIPSFVVTLVYLYKFRCKVSHRAEVDLNSSMTIGRGTRISSFVKIKANGPLQIGTEVSIGTNCFISAGAGKVSIGDYCMIGSNSSIIGNNYRYDSLDIPICRQAKTSKGITIENNVWLGSGCVVLDGTHIGQGAIITPNSVVSTDIPENAIAQGNPAKVVFTRR
jgi:acetyltransferase-like isoleucine patch superfamily enzyme